MMQTRCGRDNSGRLDSAAEIELWGGVECTINRVGDVFFDQMERSGHAARLDDLDRCAALGIRALRYPVLWERTAPAGVARADWSWSDARLARLRDLELTAIVGLVHHGSGPAYTSLIDPEFPDKLEAYARAVAERYPWIEFFTPVNEPLTTARFSGLYGAWYPHGRTPECFVTALLQQCRGIVAAMRAIRSVVPGAKLVQTDDLGKTYSTPLLRYQAEFNNEIRWLAWDLLCGGVDRTHPLWCWLTTCGGARESQLLWFQENPCPPNLVGVNHYITSLRYLDENLERYPERFHGGNGRHQYADIEVARSIKNPPDEVGDLLLEAWKRFRLPLAITECHIDATREDQLRWLMQTWRGAQRARECGADIRAVTIWALFGAFDWNRLITASIGYYEPGAYDVRGPEPRPTAVARLVKALAEGTSLDFSVLCAPGWWKRSDRFFCAPATVSPAAEPPACEAQSMADSPLLITGASGTLGRAFARLCEARGLEHRLLSRSEMDIADTDSVERALAHYEPWAIVNAAGYVRVDEAEAEPERCFRENTLGPSNLAASCERHRLPLVTFSSDLVFDGAREEPYVEEDEVRPLNMYGRSKAEAEKRVLDRDPAALVIRTSAFFGPWDTYNYITIALSSLAEKRSCVAVEDSTFSPTYVPDLVRASLDLLIDREHGIWHLTNNQPTTWAELIRRSAELVGIDPSQLRLCRTADLAFAAPRPSYSALGTCRGALMPPLGDALARYASECEAISQWRRV